LVVVGVPVAPTAPFVPVVVDVVDDEEPFVVVGGEAPPEPVGLELVVVVVVVLHTPRRCASGPHVEAVASVCSNETFCAPIVDERG
jgi:hypothetical protein